VSLKPASQSKLSIPQRRKLKPYVGAIAKGFQAPESTEAH
jgi:hypothetical protein